MIRILLYAVAVLVLLNAVAFMWPDKSNTAAHVYPSKEDVNPHFVRLNKEIEERFYSRPIVEIAEDLTAEVAVEAISEAEKPSSSQITSSNQPCYRVGPFLHQSNYELAQAVLFNAEVDYRKSKRPSKESNVYRIYLGPFATQSEVDDARLDLKRKNVLDHFSRQYDDSLFMISLGIYSTPESANTALRLFNEKLDDVKQRIENVILPDSYWLHFAIEESDQTLAQLRIIDWGEPSAKLGLFTCAS